MSLRALRMTVLAPGVFWLGTPCMTGNTTNPAPLFSIIVPTFNAAGELERCLDSLNRQNLNREKYEVILIDDVSSDATPSIARRYCETHPRSHFIQRRSNGGPGAARNDGIAHARGTYIVFLDSDDVLPCWSLSTLQEAVGDTPPDFITFNWSYLDDQPDPLAKPCDAWPGMRRDLAHFTSDKNLMLNRYLGMNCDGSVIFSTCKRTLFEQHHITFPDGLHEDISVLAELLYRATSIAILDTVLYLKHNRIGSIVNTISPAHIEGMVLAWSRMRDLLVKGEGVVSFDRNFRASYLSGVQGIVGVTINKIYDIKRSLISERDGLLGHLFQCTQRFIQDLPCPTTLSQASRYDQISRTFLMVMSTPSVSQEERLTLFDTVYAERFARVPLSIRDRDSARCGQVRDAVSKELDGLGAVTSPDVQR